MRSSEPFLLVGDRKGIRPQKHCLNSTWMTTKMGGVQPVVPSGQPHMPMRNRTTRNPVELQDGFPVIIQELDSIDMAINAKISSCMRIGARHEKVCSRISTLNGELDWVDEIRYLGVFIV